MTEDHSEVSCTDTFQAGHFQRDTFYHLINTKYMFILYGDLYVLRSLVEELNSYRIKVNLLDDQFYLV